MKARVAVLGAGIQGSCIALELASRGHEVDLYDRNGACLTQASAQNEGKIHLGFVYANDPTRRTARMMLRGALTFAPLMRRWLGDAFDRLPLSSSFHYGVNAGSLLTVEEIRQHFDACTGMAAELMAASGGDYFGRDPREPVREMTAGERASTFDERNVKAVFRTSEIGIDPEAVAAAVNRTMATVPEIRLRLDTEVRGVSSKGGGLAVEFDHDGRPGREGYDHVVNALWDGRLAIDATLGHAPQRPWLWRLRRNLRIKAGGDRGRDIPSVTNVLGPFGDIVSFGNGVFFLSWYPTGRVGQSRELAPAHWQRPETLKTAPSTEAGIFAGLTTIVPAIAELAGKLAEKPRVTEGIIFAWGETDIYDRGSGLHDRHEIGVHSYGHYHSVDTGKYTTAPLFAVEAADRIGTA